MFEEFKNLYSLSKTITFNLNPTEITAKNMRNNNHLLLHDLELNNKKHIVQEAFRKIFVSNNSKISNDCTSRRLNNLIALSYSYRCFKNNKDLKETYNKEKNNLIKNIASDFRNEEGNQKLFGKQTMQILKDFGNIEDDILSMFTKSRLSSFIDSQEVAIDNIAKRIVSNVELMTNNIILLEKIQDTNYVIEEDVINTIKNLNIGLYNQNNINQYNDVIANINQKLNQDYQKGIISKKYKFVTLQKSVLSENPSKFAFEQYVSVEDVRDNFTKLFSIYNIDDMFNELQNLFNDFENYNLDNIVIKNTKIHDFSKFIYNNHNYITNKINEYVNANIKGLNKQEKFKKQDFSIATLNNILDENVFEKVKIDTETYKKSFADFCICPIDSKKYFTCCLEFCNNIISTFGNIVKVFKLNDMDTSFVCSMEKICDFYHDFNKIFNCTRNFFTKKNDYVKSFVINWGNTCLNNPGWAETRIKETRCCMFHKNNKYYFGYLIGKDFEFEITNDKVNSYQKMINMQLGDLAKQSPRMVFVKEVMNHFSNSNENYVSKNGFEITKELFDIYIAKKNDANYFNNNSKALAKYIDLFKNYYMNYYDNRHYYDFSKVKEASEYSTLNDFYQDLSNIIYHVSFENVSDECIEKLQKENKLWLFQIYCQDFSDYKKDSANKNIHTLIFEQFFSEENKLKNFPIRLNAGFEIRYRETGLTDGYIHKKGSILLNKNDKNGQKIPDSVYVKLLAHVNGENVELTNQEKHYIDNNLLITKIANYDIIKNRRYTKPKYEIHLPFKLNSTSVDCTISAMNDKIDEYVKSNKCNMIGIDRGERNLLCLTVINNNGKAIDRVCLDEINNVNYNQLMTVIEKDRQNQRQTWQELSQIKNVKKGFISYAVKAVVDLVEKYNAIICLEGLNDGFMQSRTKIEKSIYREFVKQLINKLSYMIVNKKQSIIDVKQLAFNDCSSKIHNGIIYYVDPSYTSKIDNTTGFTNLFDFRKITNNETRKKFFQQMNNIKFEDGLYKFEFDYNKFDVYKKYLNGKVFSVDSYGMRIKRFKNNQGFWDSQNIDLNQEFNKIFENVDVINNNLKNIIINDDKICSKVFDLFKLMVQIRNTDVNHDYLISPVKNNNGNYYDTTKIIYNCKNYINNSTCCNPDMEASFNIAIKTMLKVYHDKYQNEDYFEYMCSQ